MPDMKHITILFCLLASLPGLSQQRFDAINSQNMFLQDVNGNPLMLRSNYDIQGSPYYSDTYCRANIKVIKGKTYTGIEVKLNLEDNRIIYKIADGKEMEAIVPIEFIEFTDCLDNGNPVIFRSGFPAVDNQTYAHFYQVLDSGNVQLLKFRKINFTDQKPYGSGSVLRKYEVNTSYYAYSPGKGMVPLGRGNEQALQALSDKKSQVNNFISDRNIRMKKEDDLVKLFSFYNSLSK